MIALPDGLIVIAKKDCPTCVLVEPVLHELDGGSVPLTVYSQDDPDFPSGVSRRVHDRTLETSYRLGIEIVPTLIRVEGGREVERTYGWHREDWRRIAGRADIGAKLPELRAGCGSRTLEDGIAEDLALRFGNVRLAARRIEIGSGEDEMEACYEAAGRTVCPSCRRRRRACCACCKAPTARRTMWLAWCRRTWRPARWRRSPSTR
jgi:hypothetical protein